MYKTLLSECGYNMVSTFADFRPEHLGEIETYIDQNLKSTIANFTCCNASTYQSQTVFKFLPAHRNLVVNFPSKILAMNSKEKTKKVNAMSSIEMKSKSEPYR